MAQPSYGNLVSRKAKEHYDKVAGTYRATDVQYPPDNELAEIVRRVTSRRPTFVVVEVGCGTGRYFHAVRRTQTLVGLDISLEMLRQARFPQYNDHIDPQTRIVLAQADAYHLPLMCESADLVYSVGVIGYHLPVSLDLLVELRRVLRRDGLLLFFTSPLPGLLRRWRYSVKKWLLRLWPVLSVKYPQRLDLLGQEYAVPSRVRRLARRAGFRVMAEEIPPAIHMRPQHVFYLQAT